MLRHFLVIACVFVLFAGVHAQEDEDDFDELAESTPCWPSDGQLIKRANEKCDDYAKRVCKEAKKELQSCSMKNCIEETKLRCPFRDLIRARANNFIREIGQAGDIWEEEKAAKFCKTWYGMEISNITRIAAVWDSLYMLPCPNAESAIRKLPSCFQIETANVAPTHPDAKFCYSSYPIDLGIGQPLSTQCCYGADLRLLVLGHKGAGAVDFSSKISMHEESDADHFQHDLFPSLACCALSDNCVKFGAVRPPSIRPETEEEVESSCHAMANDFKWRPYKDYPAPYAREEMIRNWAALKLGPTSLVPTQRLSEVLREAQKVRTAIHNDQDPYTTLNQGTDAPASDETTHASAETDEPLPDVKETTAAKEETTNAPEETTAAVEETTEAAEETTAAAEETTEAAEETTAAVEETTDAAEETTNAPEETTAAAEETTAAKETTAAAKETAAAHETDSPSLDDDSDNRRHSGDGSDDRDDSHRSRRNDHRRNGKGSHGKHGSEKSMREAELDGKKDQELDKAIEDVLLAQTGKGGKGKKASKGKEASSSKKSSHKESDNKKNDKKEVASKKDSKKASRERDDRDN